MKIPDNLAEMYATLTAKMPEMAVSHPVHGGIEFKGGEFVRGSLHWDLHDDEAAALIRSHWEDELRDGMFLFRFFGMFAVVSNLDNVTTWYHDPITALYHEHMGRGA